MERSKYSHARSARRFTASAVHTQGIRRRRNAARPGAARGARGSPGPARSPGAAKREPGSAAPCLPPVLVHYGSTALRFFVESIVDSTKNVESTSPAESPAESPDPRNPARSSDPASEGYARMKVTHSDSETASAAARRSAGGPPRCGAASPGRRSLRAARGGLGALPAELQV